MARVLVTGGSGLIGWPSVQALLEQSHDVVVYDLKPNYDNLAGLENAVTVVAGDVTDLPKLLTTMKRHRVDHVLHLAAFITESARLDPAGAFRTNTLGTAAVFDAALARDVRRVVWTSSATALAVGEDYDNTPVGEAHPMISSEPYGASKHAAEVVADGYRRNLGLDVIGIRPAMVYGVGRLSGGTGLFNQAVRKMALGQPTGVLGSHTLHQALYNRDMAELLVAALFAHTPEHHLFHAPVERNYDDDELLTVLRRVCPDAQVHIDPIPEYIPRVPVMDGTRLTRELGFTPRFSLEEGVREMVAQFRRQVTDKDAVAAAI